MDLHQIATMCLIFQSVIRTVRFKCNQVRMSIGTDNHSGPNKVHDSSYNDIYLPKYAAHGFRHRSMSRQETGKPLA